MIEIIFMIFFALYIGCLIRGSMWILRAILIIGSIIVQSGLKIQEHKENNLFKIILRMLVTIPLLGFFQSLTPRKYFETVQNLMIAEMTTTLIDKSVDVSIKSKFEAVVAKQLSV